MITADSVFADVKYLNREGQIELVNKLLDYITKTGSDKDKSNDIKWSALAGTGAGIWKSVQDIDKYLEEERQW